MRAMPSSSRIEYSWEISPATPAFACQDREAYYLSEGEHAKNLKSYRALCRSTVLRGFMECLMSSRPQVGSVPATRMFGESIPPRSLAIWAPNEGPLSLCRSSEPPLAAAYKG